MKIVLVSFITPASENIRGTSALPYHLIRGSLIRDNDNENENLNANDNENQFVIYTFNNNGLSDEKIAEVEKELKCTIHIIPLPTWYRLMFKLHLLFLRIFLKYPFTNYITLPKKYVEEIKTLQPDMIWVYQEELSRVVKQFPEFRRIQIGPDTESLYYYRMMGRRFVMNNAIDYWKCALMYRKYARMERDFCTDENFTYYAVGEEDVRHLKQINIGVKARFLRHPHYEVSSKLKIENGKLKINFHQPKIKVLIAGRYDLYMKQDADLLVEQFCNDNDNANDNKDRTRISRITRIENRNENLPYGGRNGGGLEAFFVFTFLGKGWEKHVETMKEVGYEVEHIKFAPDYIEEIVKHDIQITPISIGTGTKGKVLDALANGLMVIGTPYAMENIAVEHGKSCIVYEHPDEVIDILLEIPKNIQKYEEIAAEGQRQVLKWHDRRLVAKQLFG